MPENQPQLDEIFDEGIASVPSRAPGSATGRSGPADAAAKAGVLALTKWVAKDVGRSERRFLERRLNEVQVSR